MILKRLFALSLMLFLLATAVGAGEMKSSSALIYPDKDRTEFLKAVLASMDLPFAETETPYGIKVRWQSIDKAQEREVEIRVDQWYFVKNVCKNMKLPSPDSPSLKELSCVK